MTPADLAIIEARLYEMNEHLFAIETEITKTTQLLLYLNAFSLFVIGASGAVLVLVLLYKFLRKFF